MSCKEKWEGNREEDEFFAQRIHAKYRGELDRRTRVIVRCRRFIGPEQKPG